MVVTVGVYAFYWSCRVFQENRVHSGAGMGGARAAILAVLLPTVILFLLPAEIGNIYAKAGQEKPVKGTTGFWNLIPLVGFFIWLYKVQTAINTRWEQMGVEPT